MSVRSSESQFFLVPIKPLNISNMDNGDIMKVCRTCLTQAKRMHTIFEVKLSNMHNIRAIDFIRRLTSIKITKSDKMPKDICIHCVNDLCKAFDFAQMCINSDTRLKEWSNKNEAVESKTDLEEITRKKHSYKHQENKPFQCTHCDKGCITAESLRRHMKTHDTDYVKKIHICHVCSKEFRYPSFLAEHMKNHTGEKPFLCSVCGKGFRQSGALQYHIRSHTGSRPYECNVCTKKFSSPGVLKIHMRRHTNERPYVCDICGMAFRQSTDMRTHRRTHTGEKPALCTICGKRFASSSQLGVHIRTHTGEKPFLCSSCTKSFATRDMLIKHERIHTGEKPYACKICLKAFNQSSTLKTHQNTHEKAKSCFESVKEQKDSMKTHEIVNVAIIPTLSLSTISTNIQ
ncbi:hypothetical protein Trydic_g22804 [Trypoxylus dichotomus]